MGKKKSKKRLSAKVRQEQRRMMYFNSLRRYFEPHPKRPNHYVTTKSTFSIIASRLVVASSRDAINELGLEVLNVSSNPKIVHVFGKMVATRAVSMAKRYAAAGGQVVGDRINANGIIESIGQTGLDVDISPTGEVSTKVTSKTCRRRGAKKDAKPAETAIGVPSKKDEEAKVDVGHKVVVKSKDGHTNIHIDNLTVYVTAIHVDDLVVSPQNVTYFLDRHRKEISAAIDKKEVDEIIEDDESQDKNNDTKI